MLYNELIYRFYGGCRSMGHFKNFKSVLYCPVHWVINVKEEELEGQLAFFEKYLES